MSKSTDLLNAQDERNQLNSLNVCSSSHQWSVSDGDDGPVSRKPCSSHGWYIQLNVCHCNLCAWFQFPTMISVINFGLPDSLCEDFNVATALCWLESHTPLTRCVSVDLSFVQPSHTFWETLLSVRPTSCWSRPCIMCVTSFRSSLLRLQTVTDAGQIRLNLFG